MKISLGLALRNEGSMLEKTLPKYAEFFDGIVACDNGSIDHTEGVLQTYLADIIKGFPEQLVLHSRNKVIKRAEELGYDAIVIMDGDECFDIQGCKLIRKYFETQEFLSFPRIEFSKDFEHYDPFLFPDIQGRGFWLNKGYHFRGDIHEFVFKEYDADMALQKNYGTLIPNAPIYHYGKCNTPEKLWLKYTNYDRRYKGEKALLEVPEGTEIDPAHYWGNIRKFEGKHPLCKT